MTIKLIVASVIAASAAPVGASIIYQCRAGSPNGIHIINEPAETDSGTETVIVGGETDARVGDTITFAGTDRLVTAFTPRLWAFPNGPAITLDAELTIYQNNAGLPGAQLWSGQLTGVSIANTPVELPFAPNLVLPNSVCFGLALHNISGNTPSRSLGVLAHSTVTVGSSTPIGVIRQDSASLVWRRTDTDPVLLGGLFTNVDLRVEAIPAPGSFAVLGTAFVAFSRRRALRSRGEPHARSAPGPVPKRTALSPSLPPLRAAPR